MFIGRNKNKLVRVLRVMVDFNGVACNGIRFELFSRI